MTQAIGAARRWSAVGILALAAVMRQADGGTPLLLMDPIKQSLHFSDSQLAMLSSFSFIIAMTAASLPLAWIADRFNRRILLVVAIAVWCSTTVAAGFAHNFTTLFVLRMGVGIGEAALTPAAYSLLADLFPASRLARPIGFFAVAGLLGNVLGSSGSGIVYEAFKHADLSTLPAFAPREAWRLTMIAVGGVGLVVAILALLLPEPREGPFAPPRDEPEKSIGPVAFIFSQWKFFLPFLFSLGFYCIYGGAIVGWLAPLFGRNFGWSIGKVGQAVAFIGLGTGVIGPLFGMVLYPLVGKLVKRPAPVLTISIALVLTLPTIILAPIVPDPIVAVILFTITNTLIGACVVVVPIAVTSTAPSQIRARMVAASTVVFGVFFATGPLAYAQFNEHVFGRPGNIGLTLAILSPILIVIAVAFGLIAERRYTTAARSAVERSVFTRN